MNSPIVVWTVTYLLHSTLLVAAVWVAARWIRSASARDDNRKVRMIVHIRIAHAAAQQEQGMIQQRPVAFARRLQFVEVVCEQ